MGNIDFFNELAAKTGSHLNSGRMFSLHRSIEKKIFKDIQRKVHFSKTDKVLDLGGGCGNITKYLAQVCHTVVLADMAIAALTVAKKNMKNYQNVSYDQVDMRVPLPYESDTFDHVVCYSVIHYLPTMDDVKHLFLELLRIVKPGGSILIGDIPLSEKYDAYLSERKKYPVKNFIMNQKYYLNKGILHALYKKKGVNPKQISGMSFSRQGIEDMLKTIPSIRYAMFVQSKGLSCANSREDLVIINA